MATLHRTNQGGSVVNFVIISIILILAVASVSYVVTKRGEQARKDIAIVAIENQAGSSQDSKANDTATPKPEPNESVTSAESENTPATKSGSSNALPTTGPAQNLIELVAVGAITLAIFSYVSSRRQLLHSL